MKQTFKTNIFRRATLALLLCVLTTMTAWAEELIYVGYLDPTAPIGMQRKTVLNPVWVDENTTVIGTDDETTWYYVCDDVTNGHRIEVKGTVNLILTDGCNFTASKGLHVPSSSALNIYAQSVANRGSLTAENDALPNYAAIGGNGGIDQDRKATSGESAGNITIYGGNITITNGNIGGGDGGNGSAGKDYFDDGLGGFTETPYAGYGGNGGDGTVTIYSGDVWVKNGNIGGGKAGTGEDEYGNDLEYYFGSNGGGTINLSWANTSDRIKADYYYGSVTLQKAFYGFNEGVVINDDINGQSLTYTGTSYCVTIGSMPDGVTATADLVSDVYNNKYAVVGQVVTIGFSGVPDGKVPVVSVTYGNNYEVFEVKDNGDGTFSFVMPDDNATVTASELKNDIKLFTATVPDQLTNNNLIWYKFESANNPSNGVTIGETVTDGNTTLTLGTDYTFGSVTYANGDRDPGNVGDECLVEIKGIGNYGGSLYAPFTIVNPSGNGTWGSLSWALSNGELTISGTGDMVKPQNDGTYPWLTYKNYIETITIEEDVTSVADGAFATAQNDYHYVVSTVNLPSTLTSIGENAFAYCTGATITIPTDVTSIGSGAFIEVLKVIGSLDDKTDNATIISLMHQAKRADVTLNGRTLYKDGKWNTLCLPFDVDDFSGTLLEDATVMEFDVDGYYEINNPTTRYIYSYDENNHKYVYVDGSGNEYKGVVSDLRQTGFDASDGTLYLYFKNASSIKAGKPYIVKWDKDDDYDANPGYFDLVDPEFSSVKVWNYATTDKAAASQDKYVTFIGTYASTTFDSTDKSILFLRPDNKLYYPNNGASINAFRAYFKLNGITAGDNPEQGGQQVRSFNLNFGEGETPTGIINYPLSIVNSSAADAWYSLDGRRLNGKPSRAGVYINKGKRVVIN